MQQWQNQVCLRVPRVFNMGSKVEIVLSLTE